MKRCERARARSVLFFSLETELEPYALFGWAFLQIEQGVRERGRPSSNRASFTPRNPDPSLIDVKGWQRVDGGGETFDDTFSEFFDCVYVMPLMDLRASLVLKCRNMGEWSALIVRGREW